MYENIFKDMDKDKITRNEFDISFGAFDSELCEAIYYIPEGYHAIVDGNKVIIKKNDATESCKFTEENDDEAYLNDIISKALDGCTLNKNEIDWLKSIKTRLS